MINLLKTITEGNIKFTLEEVIGKAGNRIGLVINKFENGDRYYLSQPIDMIEAEDHLNFYKRVYKK